MPTERLASAGLPDDRTQASGFRRALALMASRPEYLTFLLLLLAFAVGSILSPYFLHIPFILSSTSAYIEVGIMGLGEAFVIITGNIDLSVESTVALVGCTAGVMYFDLKIPMEIALVVCLAEGAFLGWFNGFFVTRVRLPSLAVTLGTLALFRGVANILVGDDSRPKLSWAGVGFPGWFVGIDRVFIPGTPIPMPLVILIALAIVLGVVLARTTFGRWVYAIGTNEQAARYSGVPTDRVKMLVFVISGFLAGVAGLVMVSRLGVARYDNASGWVLDTITAVVLGGVSIYGGSGTIVGAVLAFFLVVVLRTGMGVADFKAESQLAVIGALLIIAILASNFIRRFRKQV